MAVSAASSAAGRGADVLERLDASAITPLHWKIMFISGMGFFTDAYDLFIIGVVMSLLKEQWTISPTAEGLVTSTAILASAVGALLFGRVADMLGRKRIYGYEVLVLAAGAIASALAPEHLVADLLPHHPRHRHRRRLPGQFHHHERIRRQVDAGNAGHAGFHHAGGRSHRRAAPRGGSFGHQPVARHDLAPAVGLRLRAGAGGVLYAPANGRNAALSVGQRPARRISPVRGDRARR